MFFNAIDKRELAESLQELSALIKSGIGLAEALELLESQSRGTLKRVFGAAKATVQSGRPLSESLKQFSGVIPPVVTTAVAAGETAGTLDENLKTCSEYLAREAALRDTIRNAMLYPAVVVALSLVIGTVVTVVVLPKIVPMFRSLDVELPWSTRALIGLGDLSARYPWQLPLALVLAIAATAVILRIVWLKPYTHALYRRLPLFGRLRREQQVVRVARTLATMLESGIAIDQAFEATVAAASDHGYRRAFERIRGRVFAGSRIADAMAAEPLLPRRLISLVRVGEQSGRLANELSQAADMSEQDARQAAKRITVLIEPVLLLGIGLMVAVLALAVLTPIYELSGSIH